MGMRKTLYDNLNVALPRFRLEPAWFEAIAIRASGAGSMAGRCVPRPSSASAPPAAP
jgi:hypothetical protein